jgi:hypothetical protein
VPRWWPQWRPCRSTVARVTDSPLGPDRPLRFVVLATVLQAATTRAAVEPASASPDRTIVVVTGAFERGSPSGLEVVASLFPSFETRVIHTQIEMQRLIDAGWPGPEGRVGQPAKVEVWSANPTGYLTRQLLRAYPGSSLTLTEDGLATQMLRFDRRTRLPNLRGLGLRSYRGRLRKHGMHQVRSSLFGLRRQEAHRLRRVMHVLPPPTVVGGPPIDLVQLPASALAGAFATLSSLFPADDLRIVGAGASVVVMGQVFSDRPQRRMPASIADPDHPRAYLQLMQELDHAGFDVLWKSHPRDRNGIRLMREALGGGELPFREIELGAAPMELIIQHNPTVPVIGMGSASLVYGRLLYGAPTFRMRNARHRGPLAEVIASALPDERALLAQGPR